MDWKQLLVSITSSVDEELRLRNAYLVAENRILRNQITGRVHLTDAERQTLAELGQQLGKKALADVATIAQPDTILAWYRSLVAQLCHHVQPRQFIGRPRLDKALEDLVVRMARENRSWGYDRIVGALANLGYTISDQTVGNILKRHGIPPAPERKKTTTWREFIRLHLDVLEATEFFRSETWAGLVKKGTRGWRDLWDEGSLRQPSSASVFSDYQGQRCRGLGRVMFLPVANAHAIRAGPIPHRQGPSKLGPYDTREAA